MPKLHFGKNFEGGKFIWLDDPIPETPNMVEEHYPVAYIDNNQILTLKLHTHSSLLGNLRNMHPHNINIIRENLGGTKEIKKILSDFKKNKIREFAEIEQKQIQ